MDKEMRLSSSTVVCHCLECRRRPLILFRRPSTAFRTFGYLGFCSAVGLTTSLAFQLRLSSLIVFLIIFGSTVVFLARRVVSRITGEAHQLVLYRQFAMVMSVTAIVSWVGGQPILPYEDVTAIGFAMLVACGRIGCLLVGCCHGSPARIGIRYREWYVTPAFPRQFIGVRLLPIQALESWTLILIAFLGTRGILTGYFAGSSIGWFIAAYCPARFVLEFRRWRPRHSYYAGLSEAQWTSVGLALILVVSERAGIIPGSSIHTIVAIGLSVITIYMVATRMWRRGPTAHLATATTHNSTKDSASYESMASSFR